MALKTKDEEIKEAIEKKDSEIKRMDEAIKTKDAAMQKKDEAIMELIRKLDQFENKT